MDEVAIEFLPEKESKNFYKFNEADSNKTTTGGIYISKEQLEKLNWDKKSNIIITIKMKG